MLNSETRSLSFCLQQNRKLVSPFIRLSESNQDVALILVIPSPLNPAFGLAMDERNFCLASYFVDMHDTFR
jgi:hypothetical protein